MINHEAIYALYPQTAYIRGEDAFDANDNPVQYERAIVEGYIAANEYKKKRAAEYPPITDYLDGIVKNDQAQIDKYIADCQAVKAKYPKGVA